MVFFAQSAVCLFDVSFRGRLVDVEEFVVVFGTENERDETEKEDCRKIEHPVCEGRKSSRNTSWKSAQAGELSILH